MLALPHKSRSGSFALISKASEWGTRNGLEAGAHSDHRRMVIPDSMAGACCALAGDTAWVTQNVRSHKVIADVTFEIRSCYGR